MSRPELLSLLRTARESPGDIAPKLVVADWLEEHGDEADRARAEFVRLAVVPRGHLTLTERERLTSLHVQHGAAWAEPLRGVTDVVWTDSSALMVVELDGRALTGRGLAGVIGAEAWAWVGELRVTLKGRTAVRDAGSPLLGHAGSLRVRTNPPALRALLASPHLASVRRLGLPRTGVNPAAARELAASPHLGRLVELDLEENPLGNDGLEELAAARSLGALRRLGLARGGRLGRRGIAALLGSDALPSLVSLDLMENPLGDRGAAAVAGGRRAGQLESLSLFGCRVGPAGARALAAAPGLARLRELKLSRNPPRAGRRRGPRPFGAARPVANAAPVRLRPR